jgi:hypothetical protein
MDDRRCPFPILPAILVGIAMLGGCGSRNACSGQLVRFSTLSSSDGFTFRIEQSESQSGSLEAQAYFQLIECGLQHHGLRPSGSTQDADLIVEAGFGDDGGREVTQTLPTPSVVIAGTGTPPGMAMPPLQTTMGSRTSTYINYTRAVWVRIRRAKMDDNRQSLPVFEGRASCTTTYADPALLFPPMIAVLLQDISPQQGRVESWQGELSGVATVLERCRSSVPPREADESGGLSNVKYGFRSAKNL